MARSTQKIESTLTEKELFRAKQAEILKLVPPEFHAVLSKLAWDQGHSCGYKEVLLVLEELVDNLLEPIRKFQTRIKKAK